MKLKWVLFVLTVVVVISIPFIYFYFFHVPNVNIQLINSNPKYSLTYQETASFTSLINKMKVMQKNNFNPFERYAHIQVALTDTPLQNPSYSIFESVVSDIKLVESSRKYDGNNILISIYLNPQPTDIPSIRQLQSLILASVFHQLYDIAVKERDISISNEKRYKILTGIDSESNNPFTLEIR